MAMVIVAFMFMNWMLPRLPMRVFTGSGFGGRRRANG
jgi:hypothetical protein